MRGGTYHFRNRPPRKLNIANPLPIYIHIKLNPLMLSLVHINIRHLQRDVPEVKLDES